MERGRFAARSGLQRFMQEAATPESASLRSLETWAELALTAIGRERCEAVFSQCFVKDDGSLYSTSLDLKTLFDDVYNLYADQASSEQKLAPDQQDQLIRELAALSEDGEFRITAQGLTPDDPQHGMPPLEALEHDGNEAKNCHFLIRSDWSDEDCRKVNGICARLSLCVKPADVAAATRKIAPLLHEFADILFEVKVMAPSEQGVRTDGVVLYLAQANRERAERLCERMREELTGLTPVSHRPFGMELLSGIAYAEFSEHAFSLSYGEDRAWIVVEALQLHVVHGLELKDALRIVLLDCGYLPGNPALIA